MSKKVDLNLSAVQRRCGDCYHFSACAAWNVGSIASMNANNCKNYDKSVAVQIILPEISGKPHFAIIPQSETELYRKNCKVCESKGDEENEM